MQKASGLTLVALVAGTLTAAALAQPKNDVRPARFGFGTPATPAQIAGWDIDVRPDGRGLPPGRGTVAQGQALYDAQCASCHGTFGESNDYMAIAGGVGTLASDQPIRTTGSKLNYATTLWDYINRAMPFGNPKSLAPDEVYALTAYVLHLNDMLPAAAALDRESIVALKLPNRDGFTQDHGLSAVGGTPDTNNVACMRDCVREVRLSSELPEHAQGTHGNLAEQTRTIGPGNGRKPPGAATAKVAAADPRGDLARASGCTACHGATQKIVGPAFREIAARYAKDAGAVDRLAERVRAGGSGVWGQVPMPPQPQLKDGEAKSLVQWILAGFR